jgi:hypothetical protein
MNLDLLEGNNAKIDNTTPPVNPKVKFQRFNLRDQECFTLKARV